MFKVALIALLCVSAAFAEDFAFKKFMEFTTKYEKVYGSTQEFQKRFEIFRANLLEIVANDNFSSPHTMGITKFSDLTFEEFSTTYLTAKMPENYNRYCTVGLKLDVAAPDSIDWRSLGGVSPVKNQGQCGSCWAFSIMGYLESQQLVKNKTLKTFSEQQLVDCSKKTYGCSGGWPDLAMDYLVSTGIESDKDYPYHGKNESCKFDQSKVVAKTSGVKCLENPAVSSLQSLVATVGPLSIVLDASDFHSYASGVLNCKSNRAMNHAVLLVGYTQDSWIIKNSWGANWGEKGFIRVSNKAGSNCLVGSYIVHSTLN